MLAIRQKSSNSHGPVALKARLVRPRQIVLTFLNDILNAFGSTISRRTVLGPPVHGLDEREAAVITTKNVLMILVLGSVWGVAEIFGKDLFTTDKIDYTPLDEKKGSFSFLRFMRSDKKPSARACCRFEIPVFKKGKRGRGDQIATLELEFDVTSSQLLDTKMWSLRNLPARVSE